MTYEMDEDDLMDQQMRDREYREEQWILQTLAEAEG